MKYLFDTDHLSVWQHGSGPDYAALALRVLSVDADDIALCVPSFHEQSLGASTYISRAKTTDAVVHGYSRFDRLLADFSAAKVLPFDAAAGAVFDGLVARRVRVGTMDLRIAAIALSNRLILLTRNARDFAQVPGLATEDWTA